MLKIRMQRIGKKGQAYFRLVVTEHTTRPKGKYLELLGSYDPHKNTLEAKVDRIKHWLSQGAQLSATANNLLLKHKLVDGLKQVTVWKAKPKKGGTPSETAPSPITPPATETPTVETTPSQTATPTA